MQMSVVSAVKAADCENPEKSRSSFSISFYARSEWVISKWVELHSKCLVALLHIVYGEQSHDIIFESP